MSAYTSSDTDGSGMIPNVKFGDDHKPITPRVRTVALVRSIHEQLFQNDVARRLERSQVQAMNANRQPFNPTAMKAAGLGGCSNQDFRYGSQAIRREMAPYVSMWRSLPQFMRFRVKKGETSQRSNNERIIGEKHVKMMRSYRPLYYRFLILVQSMVSHGPAWGYFDNKYDWRWQAAQAGEFLVPEFTKSDTFDFDLASGIREFQSSWLYDQVRGATKEDFEAGLKDPDARYNGWHVPTTLQAISNAQEKLFYYADDFDLMQREWEANQVFWSRSAKIIRCITQLIQEGDGSVTQYTCLANNDPNAPTPDQNSNLNDIFLYKEVGKYEKMSQGLILFRDSIGTDGYLHTIHGRGAQMFPMVRKLTELKNRMNDAIDIEMSIKISGTPEAITSENAFVRSGPFWIMDPDIQMLERPNADYTKSAIPVLEMLERDLLNVQATPNREQNDQEMDALFAQFNGVDEMSFSLFMVSWDELLKESFRRGLKLSAGMPGWKEWSVFKQDCLDEGMPEEVFQSIDVEDCSAVAPIGFGSAISRYMAMQGMEKLVPYMDEKGKNNWARSTASSLPGMDNSHVNDFIPEQQGTRPGPEAKTAMLENNQLVEGKPVEVLSDEPHMVHLPIHLQPMQQIYEQVQSGQMPLTDGYRHLVQLYFHAESHLELVGDDPLQQPLLNQYRKALHNLGEILTNGERELRAQTEDAQQQGGQQGQDGSGNGVDPKNVALIAKAQVHLQEAQMNWGIKSAEHEEKLKSMQLQNQRDSEELNQFVLNSQQKRAHNDALTAAKVSTQLQKSNNSKGS